MSELEVHSLGEWRRRRLLTQEELRAHCRMAIRRTTISEIESGRVIRPHPSTIRIICRGLGVQPEQVREFAAAMGVSASAARG